jgi:hypothetical protein
MPFLTAKAFYFGHGQALNAKPGQRGFHFLQFEWFDDGLDFFHALVSLRRHPSSRCTIL